MLFQIKLSNPGLKLGFFYEGAPAAFWRLYGLEEATRSPRADPTLFLCLMNTSPK